MRRRDFIKAVACSAIDLPLAAHAQQPAVPVIGFLHVGTADAYTSNALAVFRRGLQEAGFVEGQNVAIEYRYADNKSVHRRERRRPGRAATEATPEKELGGEGLLRWRGRER